MLSVVRHSLTPRIAAVASAEVLALNLLFWALPFPRYLGGEAPEPLAQTSALMALGCAFFNTAVLQFSFWSFGLYARDALYGGGALTRRLGLALVFALALAAPPYLLFHFAIGETLDLAPERMVSVVLAFLAFVALERYCVLRLFNDRTRFGNVLILGTSPSTLAAIRETVEGQRGSPCRLAGVLSDDPAEVGGEIHGCEIAGIVADIRDFVDYRRVNTIVISLPRHNRHLPTDYLVRCKMAGIRVLYVGDFYESIARKVLLEDFSPLDFLYRSNLVMTRFRWLSKSVFEKSVALVLLVTSLPLMALAAVLVKLTSRGRVLYRQVRTGVSGRPFTLLKFRSMITDAEKNGARWAQQNDPRVTRWGRVMRRMRIDELPQLFNVLRGDMSFVGPRPERPEFVEQLEEEIPHYGQRHLVKPGITGWAQVAFHYGSSIEETAEKLRYDLYYIKHMSLGFDLLIILNTIRTVLYNGGAR